MSADKTTEASVTDVVPCNLEAEFNKNNNAVQVMGPVPNKINFILTLGPLATNNLTQTHLFQESIAVGFYNQISIFGVQDHQSMTVLKEIVVAEVAEDLTCANYLADENLLAFGGALGVGYIYSLAGPKANTSAANVTIAIDSDEETQRPPEGLIRLNGHFKQIDCIEFRPVAATSELGQTKQILTGSKDFSVRLWEVTKGIQLALFLDINAQNSEVLSISWSPDGWQFLSLDVNQGLKVWELHKPIVQDHLARANAELGELDAYKDYVLTQNFPSHSLFQVLNFADCAKYLGKGPQSSNLVMLKSPLSGLCVIELLAPKQETLGFGESEIVGQSTTPEMSNFQVVRVYECPQMILQQPTQFQLFGRYAYLGGLNGQIHQIDLLAKEEDKVLKLTTSSDPCDIVCVADICKEQRDELTVFAACKSPRQQSTATSQTKSKGKNTSDPATSTNEDWNNKIKVFKVDLGECTHRGTATQSEEDSGGEESKQERAVMLR